MFALIAPHSDDECLFAAYTIMRYKPLVIVVTDYDGNRGPSLEERRNESIEAMKVLGAEVSFLGITESFLSLDTLRTAFHRFSPMVSWIPALQGGHKHHDLVSIFCSGWFGHGVYKYATYTKDNPKPKGDIEIVPTEAEFELKKRALACYKSQWKLNPQHFEAVLEARSEFYISR